MRAFLAWREGPAGGGEEAYRAGGSGGGDGGDLAVREEDHSAGIAEDLEDPGQLAVGAVQQGRAEQPGGLGGPCAGGARTGQASVESLVTGVRASGLGLVRAEGSHGLSGNGCRRLRDLPGGQAEVGAGPFEIDK